jgi:hypothetical protein
MRHRDGPSNRCKMWHRVVWRLKRSDDPDGSSSGVEEFEVRD